MESAHSEDDWIAEDSLIAMPEVLYPAILLVSLGGAMHSQIWNTRTYQNRN
jgi:hypothetical protein